MQGSVGVLVTVTQGENTKNHREHMFYGRLCLKVRRRSMQVKHSHQRVAGSKVMMLVGVPLDLQQEQTRAIFRFVLGCVTMFSTSRTIMPSRVKR